jgi:hypothetical protein
MWASLVLCIAMAVGYKAVYSVMLVQMQLLTLACYLYATATATATAII